MPFLLSTFPADPTAAALPPTIPLRAGAAWAIRGAPWEKAGTTIGCSGYQTRGEREMGSVYRKVGWVRLRLLGIRQLLVRLLSLRQRLVRLLSLRQRLLRLQRSSYAS